METIAEMVVARAGDGRPGLVTDGAEFTWSEVVAASGARAALATERRAPGAFHVATLLDNVPEHVLWLGAAAQ